MESLAFEKHMKENHGIDNVVVITSAINPAPNVFMLAITDPYTRLIQTYACLLGWILDAKAKRVVICDNTVGPGIFLPFISLALTHNVKLEVLTCESNRAGVSELGKGYGEGEILKYVMNNSQLVNDAACFYKITGRLYVKNFEAIRKSHAEIPVIFNRSQRTGGVKTRFFKCSVDYYKKRMMNAYLGVNDAKGIYIEHLLSSILVEDNIDAHFKIKPKIIGRSGSTGIVYGVSDYTGETLNIAKALALANKAVHAIGASAPQHDG